MSREFPVCTVRELEEKRALAVDVGETRIALFMDGGAVRALNETCPHRGGPLHLGLVMAGVVHCPWHAWSFDLVTGCSPANPKSCVEVYPARVEDGRVLVRLDDPSAR